MEVSVVDLVEGRRHHELLDQYSAYEEVVVEDGSALVVEPNPTLICRFLVDECLKGTNEPTEGLLQKLLPGLAVGLLVGVIEGPSAHLHILVTEHPISQF